MSVRITCLLLILSTTSVAQNDQQSRLETLLRQIVTTDKKDLDPKILAEFEQSAAQLREQHINTIADRLKLTKEQLGQVRRILDRDYDQKVDLLRNFQDRKSFESELQAINEDTESRLEPILDDKQLSQFRKFIGRSKERLPWLWGAIATADDRASTGTIESTSKASKKRGEFVIAPIPIINPTLGNGLALGAGYLYHLDKDDRTSPPSITGIGGFRTSNGSRGVVVAQKFVFKRNKYRLLLAAGRADIHFDFFGIGADSGDAGVSIPIAVNGRGLLVDGSMRMFGRNWFVGLRYYAMRSTVNVDRSAVTDGDGRFPGRPEIPEIDLKLTTAGLGPTLEYDSRSDSFYPRAGSQFRFQASFHGKAVGGRRVYETYNTFYNKYFSITPRQVLAVHASGCQAVGSVPFYDLCFFGQSKDVRGYEVGRYIDRVMIAGQAEYRVELRGRLGAAAFFGAGEVARKWPNLRMDAMKPGGGVGLRFRLTKENHINLRVDYGWGIGSRGLYLGVGEAF
ncbi:MAG TPA: BamA/TamA family outer membrane protein [Pyrinomonadaceae bacterium]|nr:BamA/TamA family outer membrane protein [Pyrinomonadaceae bacterium]